MSDFLYGGGCLNQAQTLRDWLTFAWYIKFVPGEARNPRQNKSSDVLSVYRHLTGGLAHAGDAIWLMSDDTKEDSGSLEPATAKDIFHPPTHPPPSLQVHWLISSVVITPPRTAPDSSVLKQTPGLLARKAILETTAVRVHPGGGSNRESREEHHLQAN